MVRDTDAMVTVVNTVTNKVARLLGKDETARFLNLSLYQGIPIKKGITTIVSPHLLPLNPLQLARVDF